MPRLFLKNSAGRFRKLQRLASLDNLRTMDAPPNRINSAVSSKFSKRGREATNSSFRTYMQGSSLSKYSTSFSNFTEN